VFLRGDDQHRLEAVRGNTLVSVLEVADQERLGGDLRQIQQVLASGLPVLPELTHPIGTPIRIMSGPLAGLLGTVVRREKGDEFVAVVQFLGRGVAIELQDWQVERVE
jgi:transcriptional antiterminator RfaH